ncbi:MAG: hypothetical protein JWO41_913 [Candidatus Saccharibacteria bacterium]|nr:hypothetical protein [Candidatus Saccharibacteria bacterium]
MVIVGLVLLATVVAPLRAAASTGQSFLVNGPAPTKGMLMSLASNSDVVAPATTNTASSLVGVIAPVDSAFGGQSGKVNVQTDGVANTLVSTLDGDIKAGDRITVSAVAGIGTKATTNGWIVGVAQTGFSSKSSGAVKTEVTTTSGAKTSLYVSTIPVSIKVTYYTSPDTVVKTVAPAWLQDLANKLANKHVSTQALILSFVLFLIGLIAAIVIVTSAIKNSFLSIARQPLAKSQIVRIELRSLAVAGGILLFALMTSFLLLRVL